MPRGIYSRGTIKAQPNVRTAILYLKQAERSLRDKPMSKMSAAEINAILALKMLTEK